MSESRRTGPNTPPNERLVAPPRHQIAVQGHQLLVRLVRHDLVRAHNAVPGAHDVFARIHAAAELVTAPLGLERVGDEGRPEEVPREPDVELIADARTLVGMDGACPHEILCVRQDLVARHRLLARATSYDDLRRLLHLQDTGPGDPQGERTVEHLAQRFLEGVSLAALGEVRGLRDSEREPVGLHHLQDRRRAALVRRGLDAREKGVHGDLCAVEGSLLVLVDRLHAAREFLGFAHAFLIRLVDGERERCDHVVLRRRPDDQRFHVGRARWEHDVGQRRQARHPRPAAAVIPQLLLGWQPHVSPVRPRRTPG